MEGPQEETPTSRTGRLGKYEKFLTPEEKIKNEAYEVAIKRGVEFLKRNNKVIVMKAEVSLGGGDWTSGNEAAEELIKAIGDTAGNPNYVFEIAANTAREGIDYTIKITRAGNETGDAVTATLTPGI